jgi:hypothetical protein
MSGSDSEHDSSIRINIRTGTSTRRARPPSSERQNRWNYTNQVPDPEVTVGFSIEPIPRHQVDPYTGLLTLLHAANHVNHGHGSHNHPIINFIIENSMNDGELERDDTVQLDIEKRNCRTAEVDDDCGICKEKFKLGEKLSTLDSCSHTFHHNCIDEWGKYKPECPLCRDAIPVLER